MPILGVLFDIDDTLFDYSGSEAAGVLAHLQEQGLLDRFADSAAALKLWREVMERHYARFLKGELTFTGQQRERTREFLARIGAGIRADLSDEGTAAWFDGYRAHRDAAWAAFPDAEPVLRRLAPDYRLGIVSNSSAEHQHRKLDAIGLLPYFGNSITCSEQHGAAKPAPSIFLAGCTSLGLQPNEVAYVGDKYETDAVGSHRAGLHAYWLDRANVNATTAVSTGIRVIDSLDELPATLGAQVPDLQLEYCGVSRLRGAGRCRSLAMRSVARGCRRDRGGSSGCRSRVRGPRSQRSEERRGRSHTPVRYCGGWGQPWGAVGPCAGGGWSGGRYAPDPGCGDTGPGAGGPAGGGTAASLHWGGGGW